MSEKDPITQVYDMLWHILENAWDFPYLVKSGNRIKYSGGNRDPVKREVSTADMPEVRIKPFGGVCNIRETSTSSFMTKRFQIQISGGSLLVDDMLFPVEWAIFKAMTAGLVRMKTLTYYGCPYVHNVEITDISEGVSDSDMTRGIQGWHAVWQVEVEMNFKTNIIYDMKKF